MISRTTDVFPVSKRNLGSLIPFLSFMPFFSFYMITLVQLVVLGLEAWASRLIGAYHLYGNFYGRLHGYTGFPKVFLWDEPSGFPYKCTSTSDKWWYALIFFIFLILFIISDDLFLSTQICGPSMDCKDKEIGLLGAFTIFSYNPKQNLSCENA